MLESMGALTGSPWIYAVVALSVLLDVFLPVLPSGVLVIAAATAVAAGSTTVAGTASATNAAEQVSQVPSLLTLILCAASASVLGDLVAYRLAWRGGERLDRAIARSRRLTSAQERLGAALARGGGILVIIARFAPVEPLGRLPGRGRGTSQGQGIPALVGAGGRGLGRPQRGPRLLRRPVARRDLGGYGRLGPRPVRGGRPRRVRHAPPGSRGGRPDGGARDGHYGVLTAPRISRPSSSPAVAPAISSTARSKTS